MAEDDTELVEGCRRGEASAYEALVGRYQRRVIGLCYRHLRDYEDACDLAQEVFARAFQHLGDFRGKSSFSTWLYRISLNACYNRRRYAQAKGRASSSSLEGLLERREGGMDASSVLASGQRGALESLEAAEDTLLLRAALAALDEGQRRVVELVDIEELSYGQAALILNLPVNTVRSRLNRARARLKAKLVRLRSRLGDAPLGRQGTRNKP